MVNPKSSEQLALIAFAACLGTSFRREDGVSSDSELRSEAQLLMSLLSSNPSSSNSDTITDRDLDIIKPYFREEPSCDEMSSVAGKSGSFSFSCPSLSLDDCRGRKPLSTPRRTRNGELGCSSSLPEISQPPVVSMGRPLVVDDRDALRLSAEAMARNILDTFQKAVQWRKKCWIKALARPLVAEEQRMKEAGASKDELKNLLKTPVAMVIASLNQSEIEVLDAKTSFRVMPHVWQKKQENLEYPMKKRKTAPYNEKSYYASYVLTFQTVLNFRSSGGYSEVTIEAPGVIEGSFERADVGELKLTGVSVEIDTKVLATMIEKSSRIIARASAESLISPGAELELKTNRTHTIQATFDDVTVTPRKISDSDSSEFCALPQSIITPRRKLHTFPNEKDSLKDSFVVKNSCTPSFSNNRDALRMVSPQPRLGPCEALSLDTPLPTTKTIPSLISPDPTTSKTDLERTQFLTFASRAGPSLPALVEVACAAMQTT